MKREITPPTNMETSPEKLATSLERGELAYFSPGFFPLFQEADRLFLCDQRLGGSAHKNISYDPDTGRLAGFHYFARDQTDRLRGLMSRFSEEATRWLAERLPRYAREWRRDRASFRPEEEATRRLRQTARNDLLHLDAFPSRPARGDRILRLFVNLNENDPRVWVTADTFQQLLDRFGQEVGLPGSDVGSLTRKLGQGVLGFFDPARRRRTAYDDFMLRFHDFLKSNEKYQEGCAKRFWNFPPGSVWLLFGDGLAHAELRGRFALELSFFVPPEALHLPDLAPVSLLARAAGVPVVPWAA